MRNARERLLLRLGLLLPECAGSDHSLHPRAGSVRAKLAQIQNTRLEIARMETEYQVNKAFVSQCISQYEAGELDAPTASMAKYSATEMQCRVADGCLQLFGGYGYTTEYPISRAFMDARVQRIYGGTSEVMKEIIARSVLGRV